MYELLKKRIQPIAKDIVKTYMIMFGDPDDFEDFHDAVFLVSDLMDMAYCIAKDFEVNHDDFKIEKVKL